MKPVGGVIQAVDPAGPAARAGLKPGDRVVAVNGQPVYDVLDYGFFVREAWVKLEVREKATGKTRWFEIEKDEDNDLGLVFADALFDGLRQCCNHCVFCFVDQMPAGLRSSLYVKDDDYRHSFWHGNFITLTNLTGAQFTRLLALRLSPLYISVQATIPAVRQRLLGHRRAGAIMTQLRQLARARVQMHTQIVCCPGLNDGPVLERTLADLWSLGPALASVGVVPVGLTRYRKNLFSLVPWDPAGAGKVIDAIARWQGQAKASRGERVFYAADEFFLLAGYPLPGPDYYDDYVQLANGIGLCRLFIDEWHEAAQAAFDRMAETSSAGARRTFIVTGLSGHRLLQDLLAATGEKYGWDWSGRGVRAVGVANAFFGPQVTVAGLLTGRDVVAALRALPEPPTGKDVVLLPAAMLRAAGDVTIDDWRPADIAAGLGGVPVEVVPVAGESLFAALCRYAGSP
ncbi:MAG: DUF512 domain-containing protein [Heliobacteriaceae bacterium]|nr:DUF512 domain-containing protein [Heliobacteriaceae bacterium]